MDSIAYYGQQLQLFVNIKDASLLKPVVYLCFVLKIPEGQRT